MAGAIDVIESGGRKFVAAFPRLHRPLVAAYQGLMALNPHDRSIRPTVPSTGADSNARAPIMKSIAHAVIHLSVALTLLATTACGPAEPRDGPATATSAPTDSVTLRYLGAAGWEISAAVAGGADTTVVLVDPYLTRAKYGNPDSWAPDDDRPTYTRADTLFSDVDVVDSEIGRADYIVVHHAHPDHVMDVPYIAHRTGAVVIGHESTTNIMRAYGVPASQLITVRGGEDYDFGDVSIRVLESLHSPLNDKRYYQSEVVERDVTRPLRINQLVEGGSLMFMVRIAGHRILTMGSMNFIEREVDGLRPHIALVGAAPSHLEVTDYTSRLLRLLGDPPVVMPTHADNFQAPYGSSSAVRTEWIEAFATEVRAASPEARLILPAHLEPIRLLVR